MPPVRSTRRDWSSPRGPTWSAPLHRVRLAPSTLSCQAAAGQGLRSRRPGRLDPDDAPSCRRSIGGDIRSHVEVAMKALVYHGPGRRSWEDVPDPALKSPDDAVVRVDAVTICGTDLHILKGDVATVDVGRVLGDEAALMLADILPTSYEVGVLSGQVAPGDTVTIVGAGPIGLAAVMTVQLFSPAHVVVIDPAKARREAAGRLGADVLLDPADDVAGQIGALTDGLGADVAIEAVGIPETFERCVELVRPGGRVANVGVHGAPATLHLETAWIRDLTITTGLVDTYSTATLLRMLAAGQLDVSGLVTHRFGLDEMQDAYDVFSRPGDTGALKVALFGPGRSWENPG